MKIEIGQIVKFESADGFPLFGEVVSMTAKEKNARVKLLGFGQLPLATVPVSKLTVIGE